MRKSCRHQAGSIYLVAATSTYPSPALSLDPKPNPSVLVPYLGAPIEHANVGT